LRSKAFLFILGYQLIWPAERTKNKWRLQSRRSERERKAGARATTVMAVLQFHPKMPPSREGERKVAARSMPRQTRLLAPGNDLPPSQAQCALFRTTNGEEAKRWMTHLISAFKIHHPAKPLWIRHQLTPRPGLPFSLLKLQLPAKQRGLERSFQSLGVPSNGSARAAGRARQPYIEGLWTVEDK
jgi:hypothetical protein